jgi:hypothetical protein
MSKRRDAGANRRIPSRRISHFYFKEEFDLKPPSPPPAKRSLQWLVPVLPIAVFCASIVLAVAFTIQDTKQHGPAVESLKTEAFRWAVNRAMSAAELTQTANSRDEWSIVTTWWKEAIDLMAAVPKSHPKYQLAQQKVEEYQQNLTYAQTRVEDISSAGASTAHLWTIGSRRIDVLKIQGKPTHEARYDALCQEVMYYGGSMVELSNGVVVQYDDQDKNLKVASKDTMVAAPNDAFAWTLGSSKEEVFKIQGTPSRVVRYDSLRKETLYYNYNTIELTDDRVTGYNNLDGTLKVAIDSITFSTGNPSDFWTIGSDRNDVFRVQGTPSQVSLDHSLCRETLHYGESTVELKNGFVSGYDNISKNLRVKVQ